MPPRIFPPAITRTPYWGLFEFPARPFTVTTPVPVACTVLLGLTYTPLALNAEGVACVLAASVRLPLAVERLALSLSRMLAAVVTLIALAPEKLLVPLKVTAPGTPLSSVTLKLSE